MFAFPPYMNHFKVDPERCFFATPSKVEFIAAKWVNQNVFLAISFQPLKAGYKEGRKSKGSNAPLF
jgi:hypothetical protein